MSTISDLIDELPDNPIPGVTTGHATHSGIYKQIFELLPENAGKRYATVVVGSATDGYTAADVDYLAATGSAQTALSAAFAAAAAHPNFIGTLLLLPGTYTTSGSINWTASNRVTVTTLGTRPEDGDNWHSVTITGNLSSELITYGSKLTILGSIKLVQNGTGAAIKGGGGFVTLRDGVYVEKNNTGFAIDGGGGGYFYLNIDRAAVYASPGGAITNGTTGVSLTVTGGGSCGGALAVITTTGPAQIYVANGAGVSTSGASSLFNGCATPCAVVAVDATVICTGGSDGGYAFGSPWLGELTRSRILIDWALGQWDGSGAGHGLIKDCSIERNHSDATAALIKTGNQTGLALIGNHFKDALDPGASTNVTVQVHAVSAEQHVLAFNYFQPEHTVSADILVDATASSTVLRKNTGGQSGALAKITDNGTATIVD